MNEQGPSETARQSASRDDADTAQRAAEVMYANDTASKSLGIFLEEIRPGFARMRMVVREDMLNGHRSCHGGLIFTLADSTFAFACNSYNRTTVAASAGIEFLAPAMVNDVLTAVAEEQVRGGRLGIYDGVITNQNGQRIALFRGRSYRLQGTITPEDADSVQASPESK